MNMFWSVLFAPPLDIEPDVAALPVVDLAAVLGVVWRASKGHRRQRDRADACRRRQSPSHARNSKHQDANLALIDEMEGRGRSSRCRRLSADCSGRLADDALEGAVEGRLRAVAVALGQHSRSGAIALKRFGGEVHPPVREVLAGTFPNQATQPLREGRPGHGHLAGQGGECPIPARVAVDQGQSRSDLRILYRAKPSALRSWIVLEPVPDRLDYEDVRKTCDHSFSSRLRLGCLSVDQPHGALNPPVGRRCAGGEHKRRWKQVGEVVRRGVLEPNRTADQPDGLAPPP